MIEKAWVLQDTISRTVRLVRGSRRILYPTLSNHSSPKLKKCFVHSKQEFCSRATPQQGQVLNRPCMFGLGEGGPVLTHCNQWFPRRFLSAPIPEMHKHSESLCRLGTLLTTPFLLAAHGRALRGESGLYLSGGNLCHTNWRLWHHNTKNFITILRKPKPAQPLRLWLLACFSQPASLPGNAGSPVGQPWLTHSSAGSLTLPPI